MKSVLISIHPKWCELIANGKKTVEVRRTRPKLDTPFKCFIYETKARSDVPTFIDEDGHISFEGRGQVIGEFICDRIWELAPLNHAPDDVEEQACLTREEIVRYLKGIGCGWHISALRIYDEPRDLGEFAHICKFKNDDGTCQFRRVACSYQRCDYNHDGTINLVECREKITRPPQSWCYVEEATENG